ncbi:MAG TPA: HlyD family efflux transporter periplasmic adaptor subunit [Solirubrobacteraceae bacterium]|jgi:multidrug efflux pump subunit AcrA (membrane-fusion protein)
MSERSRASWVVYLLATVLVGAIAAAVLVVGPAAGRQSAQTRTITAQRGVVQSTVSGSGNVEPASQLDLGFKASGTVTSIAVHQGEQVGKGQLVATLDPQSAEVTLEQARASLQAAEAELAREEETDGEASSSSSSSASGQDTSGARAEAAKSEASPSAGKPAGSGSGASSQSSSSTSSPEFSAATREANIASARAAVKSDRLSVQSAEQDVADTRLVAPSSGTIVSLEGEVGETVSGGGTSRASSEAGGSSASTGASGSSAGASGSKSSGASSSSSSSSSNGAFAVLSDLSSMKLVVPLSESEVGDVKRGQTATVTVEALQGTKLAAHVSEVASLPSSNSGVVSYDVTFQLDQLTPGLKAGMSATAEVVVKQAEGVNVPSSAITAGTVTVIEGTKQARRAIATGLAGDSATIVRSGLKAGERVALPLASTGSASLLSQLRSRSGAGGLGGGLVRGSAGGGSFGGGLGRVAAGGGAGPGG